MGDELIHRYTDVGDRLIDLDTAILDKNYARVKSVPYVLSDSEIYAKLCTQ